MQYAQKLEPMTLEEFEALEKDEHLGYELIDGILMMSPRPAVFHQRISFKLAKAMDGFLAASSCEVLPEIQIKIDQAHFIPDLSIICDDNIPDKAFYDKAPLIVLEILSPFNARWDLIYKLNLYESLGISEYWIIDPKTKTITIHYFFSQTAETFGLGDTAISLIRPEIQIPLITIF